MIAVSTLVTNASIAAVWDAWINPEHIVHWYLNHFKKHLEHSLVA